MKRISLVIAVAGLIAAAHAQQPPQPPPQQPPPQPTDVVTTISGEGGAAPRIAVPEFIALSKDAETDFNKRREHRTIALSSMAVTIVSAVAMKLYNK